MIDDLFDGVAEVAAGALELAGEVVGGVAEVIGEIFVEADAPVSDEDDEAGRKGGRMKTM